MIMTNKKTPDAPAAFRALYTKKLDKDGEPQPLVAVMQRPHKRSWAIYCASLLQDPTRRNRDPDVYLAERTASGDTRVDELPPGELSSTLWAPVDDGAWRPQFGVVDDGGRRLEPRRVSWHLNAQNRWTWTLDG